MQKDPLTNKEIRQLYEFFPKASADWDGIDYPTLRKILKDHEKAERWDRVMKEQKTNLTMYDEDAGIRYMAYNEGLEQENKELKEENKHLSDINYDRFFSIDELHKRNKKLKEKLEKIKNLPIGADYQTTRKEIKEILETKEKSD